LSLWKGEVITLKKKNQVGKNGLIKHNRRKQNLKKELDIKGE